MSKALLEDILEEEFSRAFEVKDREALKRCVRVVIESFSEKSDVNELGYEVKEGFKLISKDMLMVSDRLMELKEEISKVREETKEEIMEIRKETREEISEVREEIRLLIEMMNKRFEEQREYTDKRFEELLHYSDKRFDDMNKRFDDMNRRFEELIHYSDKRFEDMNKRFDDMNKKFNLLTWLIGVGFTVLTVLITVFRFIH
jgi:gas vesicle protein